MPRHEWNENRQNNFLRCAADVDILARRHQSSVKAVRLWTPCCLVDIHHTIKLNKYPWGNCEKTQNSPSAQKKNENEFLLSFQFSFFCLIHSPPLLHIETHHRRRPFIEWHNFSLRFPQSTSLSLLVPSARRLTQFSTSILCCFWCFYHNFFKITSTVWARTKAERMGWEAKK